jgi:diguanylate cyclase (GGDEF)-like protein/PAS domain S-box-containing protein
MLMNAQKLMHNQPIAMLSLTTLLATLAILGNFFSVSIFYGVDLIFGSVFVFIAVALLGGLPTLCVAIAGGLFTWTLWDHPYALLVFVAEGSFVFWLNRRLGKSLFLADGLFWLCIGIPLTVLFYSQALKLSMEASALIALKQSINGIFNVLIAGLVLFALAIKRSRMSAFYLASGQIRSILFQVMLALTLTAGTVPIIHYGTIELKNSESLLVAELSGVLDHIVADLGQSAEPADQLLAGFSAHAAPDKGLALAILDGSGTVLASQGAPLMRNLKEPPGATLTKGLYLLKPDRTLSRMKSWREGRYEMTRTIGDSSPLTVVVQAPVLPIATQMERHNLHFLMLLGGLLLVGILVSQGLSRLLTVPFWRMSKALNSATNGIIITDLDGRIEWFNQGFSNISGYLLDDLRAKKPGDVLQGARTDQVTVARIRQALAERRAFEEEVFNYGKNGQGYWVRINCEPMYRENGVMQGFIAVQTNITEQKETAGLERFGSEALAKIAANNALQDIYNTVITSLEAMIAVRCIIELDAPGSVVDSHIPKACYINTDRESISPAFYGHVSRVPITDFHGQRLGVLKVFWPDQQELSVSNNKIFEKASWLIAIATERFSSDRRLYESASVFRYASEGIFITDAEFFILDVNAAFTQVTGYAKSEAIGHSPAQLYSIHQNDLLTPQALQGLSKAGEWQGEVQITHKNGRAVVIRQSISTIFGEHAEVHRYVFLLNDITEVKHYQRQLESMAKYDALTELPNRVLLSDRLTQAMRLAERNNQKLALLFIDLDGFKEINDALGHAVGDEVLIKITQRVLLELRDSDTFARFGGDEFVVVLPAFSDTESAEAVVSQLLSAIAEKITLAENAVSLTASIGLTFYPQSEALDADQLLRQADQAMYLAKQKGRNQFQSFDTESAKAVRTRHEDLARIRLALDRNEFVLFYQPKINLKTYEVVGAEALIRWQHSERGLIAPIEFLPLIEQHALSVNLGEWVLDAALSQMTEWRRQGVYVPVSVNINSLHLRQPTFVSRLAEILADHPSILSAELELEIVETSSLENLEIVSEIISDCRQLGVVCSLDDFGTGYSSLLYLRRLPVEKLKIDMNFVRNMLVDNNDFAIVQGILALAKSFGLGVIAEGIETPEHTAKLLTLGCEFGQGYGISKPMAGAQMPDWIRQWRESHSLDLDDLI